MDIDKLCDELNNRVFEYNALIVDYSGKIPVIKVCPRLTKSFVKKYHFDDLVTFKDGNKYMTVRLQNYAIEMTNGEIVATKEILFF